MGRIENEIDVNVPVRTAYNQWTQFESFPTFMEGVKDETWEAEITEQIRTGGSPGAAPPAPATPAS